MKVIILADNAELILDVVEKAKHAVVAYTDSPSQLASLIVEHSPHFVFLEKTENSATQVSKLESLFTTVRFVVLGFERGTSWSKTIRQALRRQRINVPWRTEEVEQRQVLFDPRYYSLCDANKLKRPAKDDKKASEIETTRLYWMLRCAREVGPRAEVYRDAMSKVLGYEWRETVYRTVHDSFKSPAYARDLLSRALGYLCHFVPGADLDGLANPVDEPANFKYLHYISPPEMRYALFVLALFGYSESLAKHLYHAAQWRFTRESGEDLAGTSLMMTGLAFTMHRVGWAHATAIEWLLDPNTVSKIEFAQPRALHRALQTFSDWWGLRRIMGDTEQLRCVLRQLHDDPTNHPIPEDLNLPNFADFLKATQAQANETK